MPDNPLLCHTFKQKQLFQLPIMPSCDLTLNQIQNNKTPREREAVLYRRNHIQYRSEAYHCLKVYQEVQTFTYFFGDYHLKKTSQKNLQ